MSKDTPGNRKSSEGGQGQRGTKPVRQFLIPTRPRTISAAAAALGRAVARATPALQHRQGRLPVPRAGTSTSTSRYCSPHNKLTARERQHSSCAKRTPRSHRQGKALSTLTSLHTISPERGFIKPRVMFPGVATHGNLTMSSTGQGIRHFLDDILPDSRYF